MRDAIPRAMPLAEAWEHELNGSMDGSWKSMAIDQQQMESASTVFREGLSQVLVGSNAPQEGSVWETSYRSVRGASHDNI